MFKFIKDTHSFENLICRFMTFPIFKFIYGYTMKLKSLTLSIDVFSMLSCSGSTIFCGLCGRSYIYTYNVNNYIVRSYRFVIVVPRSVTRRTIKVKISHVIKTKNIAHWADEFSTLEAHFSQN